ncbi:Helix-turn-helix domain-containing protein [Micromonospora haikouensis]|uniref:Helix-turn-helix domain-containing protein n=1 Tax=Micromonospora haikouensis TaxID=686309 RepID=A0A1C4WWI7_9ACTN|nr:helix-turn-helix transcriptional regulator [Micromonospora haikouensis]SCF00559.1 Helix-turn-helix domain-containing protein [Micromonospora haikouensis]
MKGHSKAGLPVDRTVDCGGDGPVREQRWSRLVTDDPDEAHRWLKATYPEHRVRASGGSGEFTFQSTYTQLGAASLARVRYAMNADNEVFPRDIVGVAEVLSGGWGIDAGAGGVMGGVGDLLLAPPRRTKTILHRDMEVVAVELPIAEVQRIAHERCGLAPVNLRFQGLTPVSPAAAELWRKTTRYLTHIVLPDTEFGSNALVQAEATGLLVAVALSTFPNTTMTEAPTRSPGAVAPAAVRRAVAYIEEHADQPLTVTEVAAGLGVRALQQAFRRYLDTTPMLYLRRVRLERVHRDLQAAEPGEGLTVAVVAVRYGFVHLGRFATQYRQAYGQPPSHTLRD